MAEMPIFSAFCISCLRNFYSHFISHLRNLAFYPFHVRVRYI